MTIDQYEPLPFLIYTILLLVSLTLLVWAIVRKYWDKVEALVVALPMLAIGLLSQMVQIR
jgi:hypothetical protein